MRYKISLKYVLLFLAIIAISFALDRALAGLGIGMAMALIGGPFKDFKYGGVTLRPTKDSDAEYEPGGFDFENNASPNGDTYATGSAKVGHVACECAFTPSEFKTFKAMQDGTSRSGTATAMNGDVISVNGIIDGEHILSGGKCTVKLSGTVKIQ